MHHLLLTGQLVYTRLAISFDILPIYPVHVHVCHHVSPLKQVDSGNKFRPKARDDDVLFASIVSSYNCIYIYGDESYIYTHTYVYIYIRVYMCVYI